MKRSTKVISIILSILVIALGYIAFTQRENIRVLLTLGTHSPEEFEEMLEENEEARREALAGISVREFTKEEIEAIKKGEISEEKALELITEAPASNGRSDHENSKATQSPSPKPQRDYDAELSGLIGQIYVLDATYSGKIESLLSNAIAEYKSLPPEMHTDTHKWSIGVKYLGIASAMESSSDAQMASILNQIESILVASGKDLSLVQQISSTYKNKKILTKNYYLSLYS